MKIDPVRLVSAICRKVAAPNLAEDCRGQLAKVGISDAVETRNSAKLYNWLVDQFAFQGVSDAVAGGFVERHGNVTYREIAESLKFSRCGCPKLVRFDDYRGCDYQKTRRACSELSHIGACPVPNHNLRKGILNELAYSLFFFIRDICLGDLVGFIDRTLEASDIPGHPDRIARMRDALVREFRAVRGVSDKLINMTFATLLLGAGKNRPRWIEVGGGMIAVDSLVHNLLHRTGILRSWKNEHAYGPACFRQDGCTGILDRLAREIDAREFDQSAAYFPRFIQYAIWAYGAQLALNICNGNKIDDTARCKQRACPVFGECARIALRPIETKKSSVRARAPPRAT